jgi:AbiEi antitoxin C-terminal domain
MQVWNRAAVRANLGRMADVVDFSADSQLLDRPRLSVAAALATKQGGPISHAQLVELGFGEGAIRYWLASGRLYCYFRGVYLLGHTAVTRKGALMAAVLACGDGAVVSHVSAAWCWGFIKKPPGRVDITVPGRRRKGQEGINLHSVRRLDPRDVTEVKGVPITTPERTLLDIAEVLPRHQLRLAVDQADRRNRFDPEQVHQVLTRNPGRKGQKPLRTLLSDLEAEPLLRSEIEKLFRELCEEYDLPIPITNTKVNGLEVDAYWPEQRLIVEVDSREHHLNGKAFEDDRRRDADHLAAGDRVMRITYRQLKWDRSGVAKRLRKALLNG